MVIAVAVFQNFPRYAHKSNNFITFSYFQTKEIHNFRCHTQIEYPNKLTELCSSIMDRQETPTIQLIPFLENDTETYNLKSCSYFGEVDNMQIICERTRENILKQWGNFFQNNWKCLEVFIGTKGPNFIKDQ